MLLKIANVILMVTPNVLSAYFSSDVSAHEHPGSRRCNPSHKMIVLLCPLSSKAQRNDCNSIFATMSQNSQRRDIAVALNVIYGDQHNKSWLYLFYHAGVFSGFGIIINTDQQYFVPEIPKSLRIIPVLYLRHSAFRALVPLKLNDKSREFRAALRKHHDICQTFSGGQFLYLDIAIVCSNIGELDD